MKQEKIYLVYETDVWECKNDRNLIYIGTDLYDTVAQMRGEYELYDEECTKLEKDRSIYLSSNGVRFKLVIEESLTNAFV